MSPPFAGIVSAAVAVAARKKGDQNVAHGELRGPEGLPYENVTFLATRTP
jgi:hypothetical protein